MMAQPAAWLLVKFAVSAPLVGSASNSTVSSLSVLGSYTSRVPGWFPVVTTPVVGSTERDRPYSCQNRPVRASCTVYRKLGGAEPVTSCGQACGLPSGVPLRFIPRPLATDTPLPAVMAVLPDARENAVRL